MPKIIRKCSVCGRTCNTHEEVAEGELNISHGYCARCSVEDPNIRRELEPAQLFEFVKKEVEQGLDWGAGECPTADEEGRNLYTNVYLKRAERMVGRERTEGKIK